MDFGRRDSLFQVLTPKDEDIAIGGCCFWNFSLDFKCAEIGYELHHGYWNKGLMTEAVKAVLTFGFNEMGLHRIEANPLSTNEQTQRLLLKLGFKKEGALRRTPFLPWPILRPNVFWVARQGMGGPDGGKITSVVSTIILRLESIFLYLYIII
jgi:RimJ/RimL family protein N-acetyltransferase